MPKRKSAGWRISITYVFRRCVVKGNRCKASVAVTSLGTGAGKLRSLPLDQGTHGVVRTSMIRPSISGETGALASRNSASESDKSHPYVSCELGLIWLPSSFENPASYSGFSASSSSRIRSSTSRETGEVASSDTLRTGLPSKPRSGQKLHWIIGFCYQIRCRSFIGSLASAIRFVAEASLDHWLLLSDSLRKLHWIVSFCYQIRCRSFIGSLASAMG
jgi:hypothetical protein